MHSQSNQTKTICNNNVVSDGTRNFSWKYLAATKPTILKSSTSILAYVKLGQCDVKNEGKATIKQLPIKSG